VSAAICLSFACRFRAVSAAPIFPGKAYAFGFNKDRQRSASAASSLKSSGVRYTVEPDRAAAIRLALHEAKPGDVVLIAGKGHEKEQILAGSTIPFDDAQVALSALAELGYGGVQ